MALRVPRFDPPVLFDLNNAHVNRREEGAPFHGSVRAQVLQDGTYVPGELQLVAEGDEQQFWWQEGDLPKRQREGPDLFDLVPDLVLVTQARAFKDVGFKAGRNILSAVLRHADLPTLSPDGDPSTTFEEVTSVLRGGKDESPNQSVREELAKVLGLLDSWG
jgi:hypothetical protein